MRPARARSLRRPVALAGALALVALTPSFAAAAVDDGADAVGGAPAAPEAAPVAGTQDAPAAVVLPAVEQEDQLAAPDAVVPDAVVPDAAPTEPAPTDAAPTEGEPAAELAAEPVEGYYGTGKVTPSVVAPTPEADLSGALFDVTVTPVEGDPTTTRVATGVAGALVSDESNPFGSSVRTYDGETVTLTLVQAPEGFMLPVTASASFGPCVVPGTPPEGEGELPGPSPFADCDWGPATFEVVRDYRTVGASVTTPGGLPVVAATFELRAADGTVLSTATTDATGALTFPDTVVPGTGLVLVNTVAGTDQPLLPPTTVDVGAVATVAEAQVPLVLAVVGGVDPVPAPTVEPLTRTAVSDGTTVFVDVLAAADGHGADLTLLGATTDGTGTVTLGTDPACTSACVTGVLYRPAAGFAGTETVTYQVSSEGGTVSGTIAFAVTAPAPAPAPAPGAPAPRPAPRVAPALADTGAEPGALLAVAGALLVAGVGALAASRRRPVRG